MQRAERVGHLERTVDAGHERRDRRLGRERDRAGDGLHEHDRQRVHIGLAVERNAPHLLRRGIARRPQHRTRRFGPRRLGEGAGQAEVGDPEPGVVVEQEVGRLDVAMDQPAPMGEVEPTAGLQPDQQRLTRRQQRAAVEHRTEAPPAEVLGDEERRAVVLAPVEHRHDVRVVEAGRDLRLGPKAPQEALVIGQGRMQELDCDPASQRDVVGEEDVRGRAGADRREQAVPPTEDAPHQIGTAGGRHISSATASRAGPQPRPPP